MAIFPSFLVGMTIFFGVCAQVLLLDIRLKDLKGSRLIIFAVGNLLVLAVNLALSLLLPVNQFMKIYVLVVHIPIFLIFWLTANISAIKVVFALFTAVFLIYPANLVLTVVSQTAKGFYPVGFYLIYVAACAGLLLIINRFLKTNFNYLIKNYSGLSLIKLCLLPLAYYIANFWLGLYNFDAVKSGEVLFLRILIFFITLTAYVLILDIAKFAREKEALQSAQTALSLLLESADQQLSALRTNQEQTAVYRHDLRHHLALVGEYLADEDIEKAKNYVRLAQADVEEIIPDRYCKNNTVNLILSFFAAKARKKGVLLSVDAQLPQALSISETELCALLSNGIENAIEAAAKVADEQSRKVRISCHTHKGNLLILIENNFTGKVAMENGLPQSSRKGHGFGVKSIAMIAEKQNGYCSFEAKEGIFTLKIVLPL